MKPAPAKHPNLPPDKGVDEDKRVTSSLSLQDRIETLLERYRGREESPTQQEINDLYTDGCAAVLTLETERLRVKRRLTAAALDSAEDAEAAREASSLAQRSDELIDELGRLKHLVKQLRTAVDYAQDDPDMPPRRRFRRR